MAPKQDNDVQKSLADMASRYENLIKAVSINITNLGGTVKSDDPAPAKPSGWQADDDSSAPAQAARAKDGGVAIGGGASSSAAGPSLAETIHNFASFANLDEGALPNSSRACPEQARIDALEKEKADAVDREDYDAAKRCKQEIAMLKELASIGNSDNSAAQEPKDNFSGPLPAALPEGSLVRPKAMQEDDVDETDALLGWLEKTNESKRSRRDEDDVGVENREVEAKVESLDALVVSAGAAAAAAASSDVARPAPKKDPDAVAPVKEEVLKSVFSELGKPVPQRNKKKKHGFEDEAEAKEEVEEPREAPPKRPLPGLRTVLEEDKQKEDEDRGREPAREEKKDRKRSERSRSRRRKRDKRSPSPPKGPKVAPFAPPKKDNERGGFVQPDSYNYKEIFLPEKFVPVLIGRGGSTISHVRDTTGVSIQFRRTPDQNGWSKAIVTGTIPGVAAAEKLISQILGIEKAPEGEMKELEIPAEHISAVVGNGGCHIQEMQTRTGGLPIRICNPKQPGEAQRSHLKLQLGPGRPEQIAFAMECIQSKMTRVTMRGAPT